MKQFACGAVVHGCTAKFEAEDEQTLMQQVARHAKDEHGMETVPPEVVDKVKAGIVEV